MNSTGSKQPTPVSTLRADRRRWNLWRHDIASIAAYIVHFTKHQQATVAVLDDGTVRVWRDNPKDTRFDRADWLVGTYTRHSPISQISADPGHMRFLRGRQ